MADKYNVDPGVKPAPNLSPGAGGIGGNPGNPGAGFASLFDQMGSLFGDVQKRQKQAQVNELTKDIGNKTPLLGEPYSSPQSNTPVPELNTNGGQHVQSKEQLPVQIRGVPDRVNVLQTSFEQGRLNPLYHWDRLATEMNDAISKNPNLRKEIEQIYETRTGFNPAKKYYEELEKSNERLRADEKDTEKRWREMKTTAAGLGFSAEELTAGDSNPNIRLSVERRVLGRQSEIARRDSELKNLEFAEKTGKANEETYFKAASENVYGMLQTRFSNVVESAENVSGTSLSAITKRRSKAMSDGVISPQEAQELQMMMGQFKGTVDRDFNTLMEPYMGKMSVAKRQELRKILDDEYKQLEEDVLTGRTGILDHNKRIVDLAKQGDAYAVMQQSPTARTAGALDAINRDAANFFISQNPSKLSNEVSNLQVNNIGIKAIKGNSLGETISKETQTADPKQKAEVAKASIDGVKNMILDSKTSPESIRQLTSSLFAEGNIDMLNKHFSPNSRTRVFTALASPAMTQRMVEVGKTNPKALEDYKYWVVTNFKSVMDVQINNLKNQFSGGTDTTSQEKNPLVIGFDGQRFTVSLNSKRGTADASGRILERSQFGGTFSDNVNNVKPLSASMRYSIEAVNDINKALEAIDPVVALSKVKEGGPHPLETILGGIGINGAQRSDLQEIARAYQQYKLSEEQAQNVAGKKSSITPDKTQPVVDNPRQRPAVSNEIVDNPRQLKPPNPDMASDEELPPSEPLIFENQVVDGNTIKTVPQGIVPQFDEFGERQYTRPDGTQVLEKKSGDSVITQIKPKGSDTWQTDGTVNKPTAETPRGGEDRVLPAERNAAQGTIQKPAVQAPAPGRSSAPEMVRSNPLNLQVQTEAEANDNPMVAGFIAPTDGSYNPNAATAAQSGSTSPVATGGPLDLTRYYQKTMSAESSGNPNARAKTSSATGLFQFVDRTWKGLMKRYPQLGLTPEGRTDPVQQKRAMEVFTQENIKSLKSAGLPVTNGTLYLAHFAGDGGAKAVLRADFKTPVEKILKPEAIEANEFLRGKTAGWLIRWAERKMA